MAAILLSVLSLSIVSIVQASGITKDQQAGQLLFQKNCAVCHGSEGAGGVGVPLNMEDFLSTTS
ncbi:MAG: c-type cytochrome, partial [Gammaproteobacteria bacterium]|nr:c-type cytochrome [Gammaproteobacteria bacterium]